MEKPAVFRRLTKLATVGALACLAGSALAQAPGTPDPAWDPPHQGPAQAGTWTWYDAKALPSGRLVVVGRQIDGGDTINSYVWRYTADGALDQGFGNGGAARIVHISEPNLVVDGIGRIYAYGRQATGEFPFVVTRLLADGTVDPAFGNGQPVILPGAGHVALLPDGRILVAYSGANGAAAPTVIAARRLLPDGSTDGSLGNGAMTLYSAPAGTAVGVPEVQVMPDGAFVIAFDEYPEQSDNTAHLHKFTSSGIPDTSFSDDGAVLAPGLAVRDIEVLRDGTIVLIARDNRRPSMIARLTQDGRLDGSFGNGGIATPIAGQITHIEPEADGSLIAATNALPTEPAAPALIRLLPNGAVDDSFTSAPIDRPAIQELTLGDGAYAMTVFMNNDLTYERSIHKFAVAPGPRRDGATTDNSPTTTSFHIEAQNLTGKPVDSISTTQLVGLHGFVYPQGSDLGANADLFVVAGTPQGFYMRNTSGGFVHWDGVMSSLVPAYENVQLEDDVYVPVYSGRLPFAGQFQLYLGYMRDGGPLVYVAQPVPLLVAP